MTLPRFSVCLGVGANVRIVGDGLAGWMVGWVGLSGVQGADVSVQIFQLLKAFVESSTPLDTLAESRC